MEAYPRVGGGGGRTNGEIMRENRRLERENRRMRITIRRMEYYVRSGYAEHWGKRMTYVSRINDSDYA